MADTFLQMHVHLVFATKNREASIKKEWKDNLEKYITGIVKNNKSCLYAIYANPEHLHFIVSRSPDISEEELAGIVANGSENFINRNKLCQGNFKWQDSCSAFSVSKADVDKVCHYIINQPEHHRKISFMEEYEQFIKYYQQTIKPK